MKRSWLGPVCLGLAGLTACFSTTPPEVEVPTGPGAGGTWIRGKVSRRMAVGEYRNAVGWTVQVTWFGPDRNDDGSPDRVVRTTVKTNTYGAYAFQYTDERPTVRVEVRAVRCDFDDQNDAEACCLSTNPCPMGCESPWGTTIGKPITKGASAQIDLIVNCAVDDAAAALPAADPWTVESASFLHR